MAKLKFGSPAWRAKYVKKNKPKRKRRTGPNTYTKAGARAKRKRLKEMIRGNPPKGFIKCKAVRVVRKNGKIILQVKK